MKRHELTRRGFIRASAAAALPFIIPASVLGDNAPSQRITMGFIGTGNNGTDWMRDFMRDERVQVVAVCDVNTEGPGYWDGTIRGREPARRIVEEFYGGRSCAAYEDFRDVIERKDIDAVYIATPDHWHAIIAIAAANAKKDIFCQKPLSLTIAEGRAMSNAVKRNKVVFQTGSQQRSDTKFRKACEYVRSGRIGKVKTIKVGLPGVNWEKEGLPPRFPDSEPPPELDYDLWLGPAPWRPYNQRRVHYFFRFFWDYSGGQMTNWGAHHLDIAQWGLGTDQSGPIEITGTATYNAENYYETPQRFQATYKYADGTTLLCSSGTGKYRGGTLFEGEKGSIFVTRGSIESTPDEILEEPLGSDAVRLYASSDHYQNWLECIKSRKEPVCSVETGHRSATVCHLGNIAIRTGRKVNWDPMTEQIVGDKELAQWISRPYRAPWKLPLA